MNKFTISRTRNFASLLSSGRLFTLANDHCPKMFKLSFLINQFIVICGTILFSNNLAYAEQAQANIVKFGADPSGKQDSQAAIDKAIVAGGSAGILVPAGTFLHSGQIILPAGASITGVGSRSVLEATNAGNGSIVLTGNKSSASKIVVKYSQATNPLPVGYTYSAVPANGIVCNAAQDFSVSDCTVSGVSGNCISVLNSSSGTISHCVVDSGLDGTVMLWNSKTVQVTSNQISKSTGSGMLWVYGSSQNVTVESNTFSANGGSLSLPAINVVGSSNTHVIDNNFTGFPGAAVAILGNQYLGAVTNALISGNTINSCGKFGGAVQIEATGANSASNVQVVSNNISDSPYTAIVISGDGNVATMQNIRIAKNVINNVALQAKNSTLDGGDSGSPGVAVSSASGVSVTQNQFSNISDAAVIAQPVGTFVCTDNTAKNCGITDIHHPKVAVPVPYQSAVYAVAQNQLSSQTPMTSLTLTGNDYGPNTRSTNLDWYCYVWVNPSIVHASGNIQKGIQLPSYFLK